VRARGGVQDNPAVLFAKHNVFDDEAEEVTDLARELNIRVRGGLHGMAVGLWGQEAGTGSRRGSCCSAAPGSTAGDALPVPMLTTPACCSPCSQNVPLFVFYKAGQEVERFATRDKERVAEAIGRLSSLSQALIEESLAVPLDD